MGLVTIQPVAELLCLGPLLPESLVAMPTFSQETLTLPGGARFAYLHNLAHRLIDADPAFEAKPPLLLLHGFTGTARSHMAPLLEAFGAHPLLAPDLRGYGASQPPARDFPIDFYARDASDAAALLDHLRQQGDLPDDQRVAVLGFSDGAESALLLAAQRPELVCGVVAWGVCGVISQPMVESVQVWLPADPARDYWRQRAEWREEIITQHGAQQFAPMIEGWVHAAEAIYKAGGNICLDEAARIECPVLLINGAGEVGNSPADVQALDARIRQSRLEFVPNSGHAIHEDQPDAFLSLARAFLAEIAQADS